MNIKLTLNKSSLSNFRTNKENFSSNLSFRGEEKKNVYVIRRKPNHAKPKTEPLSEEENLELQRREYRALLQKKPQTAFLYNPDIPVVKKIEEVRKSGHIVNLEQFSKENNIPLRVLDTWLSSGLIEIENPCFAKYIDVKSDKNKKFLNEIQPKLKTSVPDDIFVYRTSIRPERFAEMVKDKWIKLLGYEDTIPSERKGAKYLIDLEDEENKKTLRMFPTPSFYLRQAAPTRSFLISTDYLANFGFGTEDELLSAMDANIVKGNIRRNAHDPSRIYGMIDIANKRNIGALQIMRTKNSDIYTVKALSKRLRTDCKTVENAIRNGQLEIIKKYIFPSDKGIIFIDSHNPTNMEYIEQFGQD